MSALPSYVHVMLLGLAEEEDPGIVSWQAERGPKKYRVVNSKIEVKLHLALYFKTPADNAAFVDWWREDIKRVGTFDLIHPLTGEVVKVNFADGSIGRYELIDDSAFDGRRAVVMEYLK